MSAEHGNVPWTGGSKISSTANPLVREVLRIKEKQGSHKAGEKAFIVIEGPHLVEMALDCTFAGIRKIFFTERFALSEQGLQLMGRLKKTKVQMIEASQKVVDRLSDTKTPQGIMAELHIEVPYLDAIILKDVPMIVVCDGINDPGNIGTIIRAADASGADAVILTPGSCDAFMPKAVRASAGSIFSVPVLPGISPDEMSFFFSQRNIRLYAADVRASRSLFETDFSGPAAIVFGNEAHGVSAAMLENTEVLFKIPVIGRAESLNVAMAASISLYEAMRRRQTKL